MDDFDIINHTLKILIKRIDDNPLTTLMDAQKLSIVLAEQHFFVEKKLRLIVDELEQIERVLSEEDLQPHDRRSLERVRAELAEVKKATEFALPACRRLAENSDKIYHEARAERLYQ
jgi:hypothetical protein